MSSTRSVRIGNVVVGGGAPVSIQSMCNQDPGKPELVARQVRELADAGCDIVRIAVPDIGNIDAAREVRRLTVGIPLVADVHFDHRVAIALCGIFDKIRINPGTMKRPGALAEVARALVDTGTPVRIGTNTGSLPDDIARMFPDPAVALVEAACRTVDQMTSLGVRNIVVSVKSSSPVVTMRACEMASGRLDVPLHLGVTEAGTPLAGAVRSATVLGSLLTRGIGDTIRVSLAGPPLTEIMVARELLASIGLRPAGTQVRACPGCGRSCMETGEVAGRIEAAIEKTTIPVGDTPMTIAVMGCEVNGPGEAGDARMAIVGTRTGAAFYVHGKVVMRGTVGEMTDALIAMIQRGQV